MLCATDLGGGWSPTDAPYVQVCPPSGFAIGVVLATSTTSVIERALPESDPASAVADVQARVNCALGPSSAAFGESRKLPAIAISGTSAEAQLIRELSFGGVEIETIAAIGPAVLVVGVVGDAGQPDAATVLRIVDSAIQRFQNPRPYGGPFTPVTAPTSAAPSAP